MPSLELVDPFGGMRDLRAKVLRTPGRPEDSFNDDALRMLRAARFAAQLGFSVEPDVQAAMTAMAGRLSVVSAERISGELTKLLCSPGPDGPVRGISVLVDTGVAEQVLPEVPKLRLERDEHFRHKDVYQHTLTVLARATTLEPAYGLENDLKSAKTRLEAALEMYRSGEVTLGRAAEIAGMNSIRFREVWLQRGGRQEIEVDAADVQAQARRIVRRRS